MITFHNPQLLLFIPCGAAGKALAVITTCFGELADGNTGNGFRYCVTGGWSPLICRNICALWCAIWAICALFVASKLPMLINCGAAAGIATGCHGGWTKTKSEFNFYFVFYFESMNKHVLTRETHRETRYSLKSISVLQQKKMLLPPSIEMQNIYLFVKRKTNYAVSISNGHLAAMIIN